MKRDGNQRTVVIVMANLMDKHGTLNPETRGRLELGCQVADSRGVREVLFMGWAYRPDCDLAISEAMRREAERRNLCSNQTLRCNRLSRDTVGDAVLSALEYWPEVHLVDPIVVTSDYHVVRTRKIFEFVWARDVPVFGAPTPEADQKVERESQSIVAFERTFQGVSPGDLEACVLRLLAEHPYYNGSSMPERPFPGEQILAQLVSNHAD